MPRIVEIISFLENFAPLSYQESYDNCGLLVGNKTEPCTGILVCLDVIEDIIDEAISKNCNLIVAHHPVIFSGLKKLTGANYVERIIIKAIQHNIAIYAIHTNLDNLEHGVSGMLAQKLGLQNVQVLAPKKGTLSKLVTYIPIADTEMVLKGIFETGAGSIGQYSECSFVIQGEGSFQPLAGAHPHIGEVGKKEKVLENRVEIMYPNYLESTVVAALYTHHPYEQPAFDLIPLLNQHNQVGSGCIGDLEKPMQPRDFLAYISKTLELSCVRFTTAFTGEIKKVALCGGSGSFLLKNAITSQADVLITGDFKYHDFFDAEDRILVCDIGHYESEIHTKELLFTVLTKKFVNIAIVLTSIHTNPIGYYQL
ncbi:Nif3-like dinuclear metal center hexameric protein [uncultured Cytophaga sp.]|uniref:Nif3-like dinuclear metal center hexameric protein n=1 Tax=uncultured Cytophaga sp. TaxID=160238 RepID=UPI00262D3E34|nr:Nif3-like dinuclear metal center hexameric protein [uncultured Cytophaga sp.]